MAAISGFQSNTTISAAFWIYKPDPAITPNAVEIIIELNSLQRIESVQDHSKVWLYYAQGSVSTSQEPYILEGAVAQAFMTDMESLFA